MKVKEIKEPIYRLESVYPHEPSSEKEYEYCDRKMFTLYGKAWESLQPEAGEWEVISQHKDCLNGNLFVWCRIPTYC